MDAKRYEPVTRRSNAAGSHPKSLTSPTRAGDLEKLLAEAEKLAVATRLGKSFTTNALARVGILSVGAIHKHLGTREEIIQKLLERRGQDLRAALRAVPQGNKAALIKGHVQAVVQQVYANWPLIEVLELERRRLSADAAPGFGTVLANSLATGFVASGVTVRRPVERIAKLLSELMISLALQARKSGSAEKPAAEGILSASMVVVDDPQWWS